MFEFEVMSSECDSFLRLRLGWRRRNEEIVKRDSRAPAGRHSLKAYTRKQKIIARSSAEAELYAAVLGASEPRGVESMMRDLGFAVKPVLAIDAKATEHILHQHGIGKMKHIDVAYLWLQDEVKSNRLKVRCVKRTILQTLGRRRAQQSDHKKACDAHGKR